MYVKDNLVVDNIERFTNGYCEVLCISIKALSTNFVTLYRPPPPFTEYAKFVEAIHTLSATLKTLKASQFD